MSDVFIKGGKELSIALKGLPLKIERNIMRSALVSGARIIADEAKANVPVKLGRLKKSVRVSSRSKRGMVEAKAKAGGKKAFYANFVEFGTAAHAITASAGKLLAFTSKSGKKIVIKSVYHTGAVSKPFMRPAFDAKSAAAINAVAKKVKSRLTEEGINTPDIEDLNAS
jgi:HK97 gp10 family phage protein